MWLVYRRGGSVPIADVPDAPLSTVGVGIAGLDRLLTLGAGVTLPTVAAGVAVAGIPDQVGGFEGHGHGSFRLVDAVSLQGRGGGSVPPCATLEIAHHGADLQSVDGGVIPAATVWGLLRSTLPELGHQILVVATAAGGMVEGLVVLNPEGDVPGLPVCPSVESVAHGRLVWLTLLV